MKLSEIMNMRIFDGINLKPLNDREWRLFIDKLLEAGEIYLQYGEEVSAELLKTIQKRVPGIIYYSIYSQEPYTMVGYIAIAPDDKNYLEFHIFKEYRNQGYCKQALSEFIEMYFSGELTGKKEKELYADVLPENAASIKILNAFGFVEVEDSGRKQSSGSEKSMKRFVLKKS